MNHFQQEERMIRQQDADALRRQDNRYSQVPSMPPGRAQSLDRELDPYTVQEEQDCQDCGGSGRDTGSIVERYSEQCPRCEGTGKEWVIRNLLSEALKLASDPESTLVPERRHIVAIVQHARQAVSTFASLPEVQVKEVA